MNTFIHIFLFLSLFIVSESTIKVLGPLNVIKEIKEYSPSAEIPHLIGNFGSVPYGKTLLGYIFLQKQPDGTNYWCDEEQTSTPEEVKNMTPNEFTPIYLVDHSTTCKYTQKAYNVMKRGGKVMLLVSDSNVMSDEYNVDDQLGNSISIPTVIIPKNMGDILREHSVNSKERTLISIKFSGVKESGNLEMDLFLRSDDVIALNFFKEFQHYKDRLGEKLIFNPVYKYYIYEYENTSNDITDESNQAPCIKDTKYCSPSNGNLRISNGRTILLENLRQSCVFREYTLDVYWNYMMNFAELCADEMNPSFNRECSENTLSYLKINKTVINTCMQRLIDEDSKVEDDYALYDKKKVYRNPELMINGVKYKGDWYSKYIFNTICIGFIDDDDICATPKPTDVKVGNNKNWGMRIILYSGIGIVVLMLILLWCYKRFINRALEESLTERIQLQTMTSIGQYKSFKEEGKGDTNNNPIEINNL